MQMKIKSHGWLIEELLAMARNEAMGPYRRVPVRLNLAAE